MNKGVKITLIVLAVLIVLSGCCVGVYFLLKNKTPLEEVPALKSNVLDTILGYDYSLEDRDTALYKRTFEALKEELSREEVDFSKYALLLSELYVIDLYTLDNKINQYDVGAVEFVVPDARDNFQLKVKDTIYKYMEDNSYNTRNQELPVVEDVKVEETKEEDVTYKDTKEPGYSVKLSWVYSKDLGYDTSSTIKLIKKDKMLYIVKQDVS